MDLESGKEIRKVWGVGLEVSRVRTTLANTSENLGQLHEDSAAVKMHVLAFRSQAGTVNE